MYISDEYPEQKYHTFYCVAVNHFFVADDDASLHHSQIYLFVWVCMCVCISSVLFCTIKARWES